MTDRAPRRATIETDHGDSETAALLAAAIRPDNTAQLTTAADGATVRTTIERETTGSLRATADDYVVNLQVASQLAGRDGEPSTDTTDITDTTDTTDT